MPGGGWSRPNGNGRGRWSRSAPRGSRSAPWPRRSGCRRRGCTSLWPPPTGRRWTRRSASWSAPEDPDSGEDAELGGRGDTIADRLSDEVSWLRQCAGWLAHLGVIATRQRSTCVRPPTGRTGPSWPSTWRGRQRSSTALPPTSTNSPGPGDPGPDHRRGAARPAGRTPPTPAGGCPLPSTPQLERAWDAWQAERYQRGEISQRPGYTDNPFRPR